MINDLLGWDLYCLAPRFEKKPGSSIVPVHVQVLCNEEH